MLDRFQLDFKSDKSLSKAGLCSWYLIALKEKDESPAWGGSTL